MDLGLKGKVAFVAASSDGLGKASALELAKEGAQLILCGRRKEKLQEAGHEISELTGNEPLLLQGDLSVQSDRDQMIRETISKFESVDVLVTNNGGPPSGKFEDFGKEDWDRAYEQLLASSVHLIDGFLPGMKAKRWGRIISITSQAVKQPVGNLILSNSVRASVVGLIKTLSVELGEFNITANNIMPGYTETARLQSLIKANPEFNKAVEEVPLQRFGQPHEFAAAVAFLASERASYITGVSLAVDGGWIKNIL